MISRRSRRRGSAIIEFVLVGAFFLLPMILGLLSVGFALSRSLQVAQLTRDVGRMAVRGVDFAVNANQELIVGSVSRPNLPPLAGGLGMRPNGGNVTGGTSGNGVLVFSTLSKVSDSCNCSNSGQIVLTKRVVVGNKTLFTSTYGSPSAGVIDADSGAIINYPNEVSARASSFSSVVDLSSGEFAYLVEARFTFPDLSIPGIYSTPAVSWLSVF
jgi:hypothetical protein